MNVLFHKLALVLLVLLPCGMSGADIPDHPRLFLSGNTDQALVRNIAMDPGWRRMHRDIVTECDTICTLAPMQRILEGPRLHAVSCEVLRRVFFLSYAWRTEKERKYADRAIEEMLAVCDFTDWNPKHFLDVAEMTTALAIGYDWLYPLLTDSVRHTVEENILHKGLLPSEVREYHYPFMIKNSRYSNWGQVCHGGLAIGALAVLDRYPEVAGRILERSRQRIFLPMMRAYPPDGCYPEGFGYWAFGTQYNVLMIAALEGVFGQESVSSYKEVPGFIASGGYSQQVITPTLHTFGYSDNSTRLFLEPVAMWFNSQRYDPALFYMQKRLFDRLADGKSYVKGIKNRLIPAMIIWGAGIGPQPAVRLADAEKPSSLFYLGRGENPICVMRSGWDTEDIYLGFKSGRPDNFHGHMDIGSFYLEAQGVRWAVDLGSDPYGDIAKAKIGMFNMTQESPRWTVLTKYNNMAHSTLTLNGNYQLVNGQCGFTAWSDDPARMWVSADLTPVYAGSADSIGRVAALVNGCEAEICDCIRAGNAPVDVCWNMTTPARLFHFDREGNTALLRSTDISGKERLLRLQISLEGDLPYDLSFVPARSRNDFESPNTGISFLKIRYRIPAGTTVRMTVRMIPEAMDSLSNINLK